LCCKKPGEEECLSSFAWNKSPYDVPDMYAKPGTPCNDYIGYCDVFQKCREVDPSGPLATLRKLLLSEESIASFKKWVVSNWYAVSLIIVAVFALLVSFEEKKHIIFFLNQLFVVSTQIKQSFIVSTKNGQNTSKIVSLRESELCSVEKVEPYTIARLDNKRVEEF
jgi:hypothetical protein